MKYRTIKTFIKPNGETVKDWVNEQPKGAQAEINTRLRYLETQKIWGRPYSAKLKGKFNKIHEIIITWNRNQYRPLGFFGSNKGDFTLLIGAKEKDSKFEPKNAPAMAEDRRKLVLKDGKYAIKYFL